LSFQNKDLLKRRFLLKVGYPLKNIGVIWGCYYHCPKNVLCSILSFYFWIFPSLDTEVQLESADSKQKAISLSLFQDSFRHIWAMRKMHHTFWKKPTFREKLYLILILHNRSHAYGIAIHIYIFSDFHCHDQQKKLIGRGRVVRNIKLLFTVSAFALEPV
jgi:hypothetical protein